MKALAAIVLSLFAHLAMAAFPDKPIHLVVPWPAGGPSDALARMITAEAGKDLGQPIVIDNRIGASGTIGTDYVAKAKGDGYTLLWTITNHTTNHELFKVNYDPAKDFTPVGLISTSSYMMLVNPQLPVKTLKELVDYVKSKPPGSVSYASAGSGTLQHLGMELFKGQTGLDMVHVPYKGSAPAIVDVLGGHLMIMFESTNAVTEHIRGGKLRPLAVASPERLSSLPDLPTAIEAGYPGFVVEGFTGVYATAGTPPDAIARLNAAFNKVLAMPQIRDQMTAMGLKAAPSTPAEFGAYVTQQIPKYSKILKQSGAKVD